MKLACLPRPIAARILLRLAFGLLACATVDVRAGVLLRAARTSSAAPNLLANGSFDQIENGLPARWSAAPQGFRLAPGEGRDGSNAIRVHSPTGGGWHGTSQTIVLQRTVPVPLVIRGWSKAAEVSGGTDSGYSLYADLIYDDGTPLWG